MVAVNALVLQPNPQAVCSALHMSWVPCVRRSDLVRVPNLPHLVLLCSACVLAGDRNRASHRERLRNTNASKVFPAMQGDPEEILHSTRCNSRPADRHWPQVPATLPFLQITPASDSVSYQNGGLQGERFRGAAGAPQAPQGKGTELWCIVSGCEWAFREEGRAPVCDCAQDQRTKTLGCRPWTSAGYTS